MKSPIILRSNSLKSPARGFLTMEIMLAFSLMILFTISTFTLTSSMHSLKIWSLKELDKLKTATQKMDQIIEGDFENLADARVTLYGDDTRQISIDHFIVNDSDYEVAWGKDSCNTRLSFDKNKNQYFKTGVDIGSGNISTDLEVRNGIVYLTADSASASKHDFFIIDSRDYSNLHVISSLNTGPGVSSLEVVGPYVFMAQSSSVNQLQIIDIHDRSAPRLISELKVPLSTPTTTAPFATSIFYSQGLIYLGTAKWHGPELSIIDVSNVYDPTVVGVFETGTLINDIYVRGDLAYLATSDDKQMRILDISDRTNPVLVDSFVPSGWQTQEGKILEHFENFLAFGRTVGGFNVLSNHEAFLFSTSTENLPDISTFVSKDIPGGVYGILLRLPNVFLMTHDIGHEFKVFDSFLKEKVYEIPLFIQPTKMACDGSDIFFSTGDSGGVTVLKSHE